MKIIRTVTILLITFIGIQTNAQNLKIGHINSSDILKLMPEVIAAQGALEKFSKELQNQSDILVAEYQKKTDEYQALPPTTSDILKKDKETEIVQLEQRIKKFQEDAQGEVSKKQAELLEPIMKKLQDVIKEVAKEKGYDYILDTSTGSVVFQNEAYDISSFVKKKLNILN
jgi:outer membrane protein